jgi:hypothetical protein
MPKVPMNGKPRPGCLAAGCLFIDQQLSGTKFFGHGDRLSLAGVQALEQYLHSMCIGQIRKHAGSRNRAILHLLSPGQPVERGRAGLV